MVLFPPFPPFALLLSLGQECSGNMVDRDQQMLSQTDGLPRSAHPGIYLQAGQGLRNRKILREPRNYFTSPNVVDRPCADSEQFQRTDLCEPRDAGQYRGCSGQDLVGGGAIVFGMFPQQGLVIS